jgi:hypothetical protein
MFIGYKCAACGIENKWPQGVSPGLKQGKRFIQMTEWESAVGPILCGRYCPDCFRDIGRAMKAAAVMTEADIKTRAGKGTQ